MATRRRTLLVALGGMVAGGGALLGTGAFTAVQAERTVTIETTQDASAFLALQPARDDGSFVEETDGTIEVQLDGRDPTEGNANGLNQNAISTFRNLVQVTNNGTQEVTSLRLEFTTTPGGIDPDTTFTLLVDDPAGSGSDDVSHSSGGVDVLTGSNGIPTSLDSGESINLGLEIDLIDGGNDGDLPDGGEYDLTIAALTANNEP